MVEAITGALSSFTGDLESVATVAVGIGAAALLVWIGFRLSAKLANRGTGR